MSLKRAIALSFLLLAGTLILAHAVIPHHHHDGLPVVAAHDEHEGNAPDHNTQECWLLPMFKVRLGNDKQMCQSPDFDHDLLPCLLTLFSDYAAYQIKNDAGSLFVQPPYIQLLHTAFIVCSAGLRAPPHQLRITN